MAPLGNCVEGPSVTFFRLVSTCASSALKKMYEAPESQTSETEDLLLEILGATV